MNNTNINGPYLASLLASLAADPASRHGFSPDERQALANVREGLTAIAGELPKRSEPAQMIDGLGNAYSADRAATARVQEAESLRHLNSSRPSGRTPGGWTQVPKGEVSA